MAPTKYYDTYSINKELPVSTSVTGKFFPQQSFLGATILDFSASLGYGSQSSTLTVNLIEDDVFTGGKNQGTSAATPSGQGHDVYHRGALGDNFQTPMVGSPVYFHYGVKSCNVDEGFRKTIDDLYGATLSIEPVFNYDKTSPIYGNIVNGGNPGHFNFAFGGILQAVNHTQSASNSNVFNVTITDPRDVLDNVELILNGYAGGVLGAYNIMNIYGFLEHNPVNALVRQAYSRNNISNNYILQEDGSGTDCHYPGNTPTNIDAAQRARATWPDPDGTPKYNIYTYSLINGQPITGTGMSRRNDGGIPYYRIVQAYNYLIGNTSNTLPIASSEYGSYYFKGVRFRGYKYWLDLSEVPFLPYQYRFNYDTMTLLELIQEICEVTNHKFYVTLLPVTNHGSLPINHFANSQKLNSDKFAGIIKVKTIDKSLPSKLGSIENYVSNISSAYPTLKHNMATTIDYGLELSNEITHRMVIGGSETQLYFFENSQKSGAWSFNNDSIIPFYGFLGPGSITIPRGYGPYQQILLDAAGCCANGVGRYYVATEMELRAATISFEKWTEFLLSYNSVYMENVAQGDIRNKMMLANNISDFDKNNSALNTGGIYSVTVPRCLFRPHPREEELFSNNPPIPINPCHPPFGFPLYYGRATAIGLPHASYLSMNAQAARVLDNSSFGNSSSGRAEYKKRIETNAGGASHTPGDNSHQTKDMATKNNSIKSATTFSPSRYVEAAGNISSFIAKSDKAARSGLRNAKIVYDFVRRVADEHMGKKFAVLIPQRINPAWYTDTLTLQSNYLTKGPFGFPPRNRDQSLASTTIFPRTPSSDSVSRRYNLPVDYADPARPMTNFEAGCLRWSHNHSDGTFSYNYEVDTDGGYYSYDLGLTNLRKKWRLFPYDRTFLESNGGKISSFVRFNHSQYLDFSKISKDSFSQEYVMTGSQYGFTTIPDIANQLSNTYEGDGLQRTSAGLVKTQPNPYHTTFNTLEQPKTAIAFVKVDVDPNFYHAPRFSSHMTRRYGGSPTYTNVTSPPKSIFDPEDCTYKDSYRVSERLYSPGHSYTELMWNCFDLQETEQGLSNPKYTYVIITLPERVRYSISTALRDGLSMQVNSANYRHFMLQDVVDILPFAAPTPARVPVAGATTELMRELENQNLTKISIERVVRKAYEGLTFSLHNHINMAAPSPAIPDIAAIALKSHERNYGPWTSTQDSVQQMPGKTEVTLDESLAPWNYGGWEYMDKAGRAKVESGTSANFFSERGSVTLPMMPSGINLGMALGSQGPPISNISCRMTPGGATTTFSIETYTHTFGKMSDNMAKNFEKIGRLQKARSTMFNNYIKNRIGKSQTNFSYGKHAQMLSNQLAAITSSASEYSLLEQGKNAGNNMIIVGANRQNSTGPSNQYNVEVQGSSMSDQEFGEISSYMATDGINFSRTFSNTAGARVEDMYLPTSTRPHNFLPFEVPQSINNPIYSSVDGFDDEELSGW
jgi:hypothetical protein